MNSKIKELYFPIWKNYSITIGTSENNPDYGFAYTTDYQEELFHSNMEKFAELIIKECTNQLREAELEADRAFNAKEVRFRNEFNGYDFAEMIENRFGIKR